MHVYEFQKPQPVGRFQVYCFKVGTSPYHNNPAQPGVRDWGEVPAEVLERLAEHVRSRSLPWVWEVEIDGWEFQGQDREEKRIMEEIRDNYDLLAPLSMERKRKLWHHGMRALIEGIPMPSVWKNLQDRRAEPSEAIEARIAGLESRLEMLRAN